MERTKVWVAGKMIKTIYRTTNLKQWEKLRDKLDKEWSLWWVEWSKPADKEQIYMRHKILLVRKNED